MMSSSPQVTTTVMWINWLGERPQINISNCVWPQNQKLDMERKRLQGSKNGILQFFLCN